LQSTPLCITIERMTLFARQCKTMKTPPGRASEVVAR